MDFSKIEGLERELNDPSIRKSRDRLNELIADNFEEIGKSGKVFNKADIIADLLDEQLVNFTVSDFRFERLAADCILVKYKTTLNNQSAHRCSIWREHSGRWQIHYHQGTVAENAKD